MLLEEFKLIRENVWLYAWISESSCKSRYYEPSPIHWADCCLKEFDLKFPQYKRLDKNKDITP